MPVHRNQRHLSKLSFDDDPVPFEGTQVHPESVLDQIRNGDVLKQAALAGVGLLNDDDFLNVLDIAVQILHFAQHVGVLGDQVAGERFQVSRQHLPFRVVSQKLCQIAAMLVQQRQCLAEFIHPRLAQALVQEGDGDIDAVENVADVVQCAGGDFGHAGLPVGQLKPLAEVGDF